MKNIITVQTFREDIFRALYKIQEFFFFFFFFNLGAKRTFLKYSFTLCIFLEGALKLQGNIKENGFM